MQPVVYHVAASLDGFIAAPDGSFADFPAADDFSALFLASLNRYAAVVMGRHTWEVGVRDGMTNPFPFLDIDKVVVSTSLTATPDPAIRVTADPIGEVTRMKQVADGPIWLCGGSVLAGRLLETGLIDELVVKHNPILLGDGIPLFARRRATTRWKVGDSHLHEPSGIRTVTYHPA